MSEGAEVDYKTVVIIGGGPAGVAAAIWLKQFGLSMVLLESNNALGGLQKYSPYNNDWIPGLRAKKGIEIAAAFHQHVHDIGCDVRLNAEVTGVVCGEKTFTITLRDNKKLSSQFVVLATGTTMRSGGFVESDSVGIGPGLSMERLAVKGKRVAILGGGDNAFDQAVFAMQRGASVVKIFTRNEPRAQPVLQARFPNNLVSIGPFLADQKTMTVNNENFDFFGVQYGFEAAMVPGLSLERNEGYIAVDQRGETSLPRVYACGDATNFWHPCVVTACAHGIQVAKTISLVVLAGQKEEQVKSK